MYVTNDSKCIIAMFLSFIAMLWFSFWIAHITLVKDAWWNGPVIITLLSATCIVPCVVFEYFLSYYNAIARKKQDDLYNKQMGIKK